MAAITTAWATDYDLWICGTRVTSDNFLQLSNIVGVRSGAVYYTDNTLHLSRAHIFPSDNTVLPIYAESGVNGLKIDVTGVCTIEIDASIGIYYNNISYASITGSGILIIKAKDYGIYFNGKFLMIKDGVTVCLMDGGIDNDGNNDERLEVDSANLFVRRTNPSLSPIYMHELVLRNAHLESPAWSSYEWSGAELTNGQKYWHGDINIKAGEASDDVGIDVGLDGDVNYDGLLTLADVTALVNKLLGKNQEHSGREHEYIDFGLPSGTLWATCNIGADDYDQSGAYFAWGETVPYGMEDHTNENLYNATGSYTKNIFSWATYKWCDGTQYKITKYTDLISSNDLEGDYLTELQPIDDAAYIHWGSLWRTPSKAQWIELFDNVTTHYPMTLPNGVKGWFLEKDGKTMFLPCAGYRMDGSLVGENNEGYYWSRNNYTDEYNHISKCAKHIQFNNTNFSINFTDELNYGKCCGLPIRPVRAQ